MQENKDVLIISDGKPGHLNQSLALCELKNLSYDILEIKNISKAKKILTYIFDYFYIYINIFKINTSHKKYKAIISTGSSTYYINKYLSKKLLIKSIAIMLPKSFRLKDFNYIISYSHDKFPNLDNIIEVPLTLSINRPKGIVKKSNKKSIGIIIGGNNSIFSMNRTLIKKELDKIFVEYEDYDKFVTTSRRTPKEIDRLLEEYSFEYQLIYSKNEKVNPIPDFIDICDELFITIDSTSMISEAKANSSGNINIINLDSKQKNTKFHKLVDIVNSLDNDFSYTKYLNRISI